MSHPTLFLSTNMTASRSQQEFCHRQIVANIAYFPSQEAKNIRVGHKKPF